MTSGRCLMQVLAASVSVDEFAEYVSVPGVPRRFFQQVHQHPAKADRCLFGDPPAWLVEARCQRDGVGSRPRRTVATYCRRDRVAGSVVAAFPAHRH